MTNFAIPRPDDCPSGEFDDEYSDPYGDLVDQPNVLTISGVIAGATQSFLEDKAMITVTFPAGGERHQMDFYVRRLRMGPVEPGRKPEVRVFVVLPEGWEAAK